jgi:hypothetical protein
LLILHSDEISETLNTTICVFCLKSDLKPNILGVADWTIEMLKACIEKLSVIFVALIISVSSTCVAHGKAPYRFDTFELRGSRYFSNYNTVVGRYLRQHSPHRRARACVVGQRVVGQRNETAYVIWRGGDKLILWWGGGDDDLNRSNRILSLRRDVVASDSAVGTSTYRVSRRWVAMVERKCAQAGRYVTVN